MNIAIKKQIIKTSKKFSFWTFNFLDNSPENSVKAVLYGIYLIINENIPV